MPWTRLNPAKVLQCLRADCGPASKQGDALAEQALAHVREELLSGNYIAVQDHLGRTFIGTEAEAAEFMMAYPAA